MTENEEQAGTASLPFDPVQMGARLRAYRMGSGLRAEQIADKLQISRAALYRMEGGEIVKIETLFRLAEILNTSLASLLGAGTEYYVSAVAYIERMRQLEVGATRVLAHFDPISILLTSEKFEQYLSLMIFESQPGINPDEVAALLELIRVRKRAFAAQPIPVLSLIGLRDLERLVYFGFVGRMGLPTTVRMERILAAREEVERIAAMMEAAPETLSIGVLEETLPSSTFQVFERPGAPYVAVSPYRFVNFPNITTGIASVTAAPEAVSLYEGMAQSLWARAHKGAQGAALIRKMMDEI